MMHGSAFHGANRGFTDEKTFGRVYDKRVILRLLPYVIPYKRLAALATVAMLIYTASQVSIPFLIKLGIDSFIEEEDFNGLTIVFGAFITVAFINWIANYTQQLSMEKVGQGVLYDLRRTMFGHLQKLSLSYYDRTEVAVRRWRPTAWPGTSLSTTTIGRIRSMCASRAAWSART